ncbi:MAG TPA: R3H domain-containing nucleic acid-binding protein [Geothrix sp.]|nr:R3H domain-containing nucleic acid-binding protein [Geothrix sp.]
MRKNGASLESVPELITRWSAHLGLTVEAKFSPSGDEEAFPNRLAVSGPDADLYAASRGVALDALQFLVHEAQGEREDARLAYLDVKGARLFRMQEVMAMGRFAAEKARELGSHTLGALSARERRWVHLVVSREEGLGTESEGTGTFKPVRVFRK